MPVELRKRKAPAAPPPAPPAKKQSKVAKAAIKVKETVKETAKKAASTANGAATKAAAAPAAAPTGKPVVADVISLDGFGGEIQTNDGETTSLKALVDESKAGVVLFTYPKASTPGCTRQACLFRDSYTPLTASGLSIYGLSTDSPKANTTFKEKQKLPYPLLCDPSANLIAAIGLKKTPKGTVRGVFVVDKSGKVLAAEPGGPEKTVEVVRGLVGELGGEKKKEELPTAEEVKEAVEGENEEDEVVNGNGEAEKKEEEKEEEKKE